VKTEQEADAEAEEHNNFNFNTSPTNDHHLLLYNMTL
jgi:hypothetical protein